MQKVTYPVSLLYRGTASNYFGSISGLLPLTPVSLFSKI